MNARSARLALVLAGWCLAGSSTVFAQAVLTGVVKDASGGVLPGVTVEAASPALIEKVRSAVSDGTGQYRIIDLRPGSYDITFTLTGFSTVKREGVVLAGTATAVINADLKVGSVSETVTVTGESQLVDVQGVATERSVTRELIDAVPSGRTVHTLANLIPGISISNSGAGTINPSADVGGSAIVGFQLAAIHGGNIDDQRIMMDGLPLSTAAGNRSAMVSNLASTQEFTIDTSGTSAEDNSGGVRMNVVPREGGNVFHFTIFADGTGPALQSSNYTSELAARGYAMPNPLTPLKKLYTVNPAGGGPLKKDTLWLYIAANRTHSQEYRPTPANKNANDPSAWLYVPDPTGATALFDALLYNENARLTWQIDPKNKLAIYYDTQVRCACPQALAGVSPEAQSFAAYPNQRFTSATYTAPITSRVLVDAAVLNRLERTLRLLVTDRSFIRVIDSVSGITYRSFGEDSIGLNQNNNVRAAVSWVTGSHSLKTGFQTQWASAQTDTHSNPASTDYTFANGVPTSITLYADPRYLKSFSTDFGAFVQDRWTIKHVTLTGGLRYDRYHSYYPAATLGPVLLAPNRNVAFDESDGVRWNDITPRLGAAWDVFGNGKTAVKTSLNKYLGFTGVAGSGGPFAGGLNPANRVVNSTTRSWNDANKNFIPDCNMASTAANGECGAMANAAFGLPIVGTNYDPALLNGWGIRDYNWEFVASVQQQVSGRVSVDLGYFRRSYGNFKVTDNLSVAPSDFNSFSIVAPVDARLPNGGGQTIAGLYNVTPAKFGQTNNFVTNASNYGDQIQRWQGVDATASVRAWNGLTIQGGLSTGSTLTDNCAIVAQLPEVSPNNPYCHAETRYLTQIKGLGTYQLPRIDVQVSLALQSTPGPQIAANFNATNAFTQPSLGRPLSGNASNVSVNLVAPGTLFGDRVNQLDLRVGKIFRFAGRGKLGANVDLFNIFNRSPVVVQNDGFSTTTTTWQQPQQVLNGRLVKFSAQFDF